MSVLISHLRVCHRWAHLSRQIHSALYVQNQTIEQDSLSYCHDGISRKIAIVPRRHMSFETYNTYFSPESPPIRFAQNVLEGFHDMTGLPWWAALPLTTFIMRTVITLPITVYSHKVQHKVQALRPEVQQLSERLKTEVAYATKMYNWSPKYSKLKYRVTLKKLIRDLYIRDNCHPAKQFLILWVQLPLWVSMSFALRNMSGCLAIQGFKSEMLCPALATEGALWFSNLAVPDATFLLPLTFGIINLINVEIGTLRLEEPTKLMKGITWFLRGIIVMMVPIGSIVPSCMCLYWTSSSLFGLTQNLALKLPRVRRAVGIPASAGESPTPFKDMAEAARRKYFRKKI
ncbi:hypothetical protein ScPMuIL_004443 [Solemya velum]